MPFYFRKECPLNSGYLSLANLEAERNAVMLEYMKEKDVASMSGRLLNRWGRVKKPQLLARLDRLEQQGQIALPGFDKGISA
ncbi:transcriptional regulator [Escherichia coli O145:H28]|nr:transcriptional regulator [Escherichia coli O145:H28]